MQKNQSLVDFSLLADFHRIVSFSTGCWIRYFSVVMWHSNQTVLASGSRVHSHGGSMAADFRHNGRNGQLRVHILNVKHKTERANRKQARYFYLKAHPLPRVILPPTSLPKQRHLLATKCSNAQDCKATFLIKISMFSGGGALQAPQVLLKSCWQILAAARGRSTLLEGVSTGVFPVLYQMTSQLMHVWAALNGTSQIFFILFLGKRRQEVGRGTCWREI